MANAMIFYRTPTTRKIDVPNPANLPAAQKLLFTPPNDLAASINEDETNNIVRKSPPAPGGRRIIQTDEGKAGWLFTIEGNLLKGGTGDTGTQNLHALANLVQSDSYHIYGIFGIQYPNGPSWLTNFDPDNTKGLMIVRRGGGHVGTNKELLDFSIQFSVGGDIV